MVAGSSKDLVVRTENNRLITDPRQPGPCEVNVEDYLLPQALLGDAAAGRSRSLRSWYDSSPRFPRQTDSIVSPPIVPLRHARDHRRRGRAVHATAARGQTAPSPPPNDSRPVPAGLSPTRRRGTTTSGKTSPH